MMRYAMPLICRYAINTPLMSLPHDYDYADASLSPAADISLFAMLFAMPRRYFLRRRLRCRLSFRRHYG